MKSSHELRKLIRIFHYALTRSVASPAFRPSAAARRYLFSVGGAGNLPAPPGNLQGGMGKASDRNETVSCRFSAIPVPSGKLSDGTGW